MCSCPTAKHARRVRERLNLPAHPFHVRRRPVDALAARTADEARLGGINVRWYTIGNLFPRHWDHGVITARTPGEQAIQWVDGVCRKDLSQLLAEMIAGDEQQRDIGMLPRQAPVPRQDDATLRAGVAHEGAAGQVRAVGGILTEDAQPTGETAEHFVDGKAVDHHVRRVKIVRRG
ncbi:MAG: hypothetical protein H6Q33_4978 [Deltaproteobacteria bacterium]|nr:hypothetical protein [Deltaproteobacteria bacterium]